MTDLALAFNSETFRADLVIANGDLKLDGTLRPWITASLFTDIRPANDDTLPADGTDKRGFWADVKLGSKLWLLWREKQTEETRLRAEQYAREALAWLIGKGIAKTVTVHCTWVAMGVLGFDIVITRASNVPERYSDLVWRLAA
ncbi:MAG: phage GP46 family protein [Alphaproteobacteria bacterium]|nr:phage GP46 family protein [Alphaproteobacteria bacterium]